MGAKNIKLKTDYYFDFELLGFVAPMKEYKLGWLLNHVDELDLVKEEDIKITLSNDFILRISNLQQETEFQKAYLLTNKLVAGFTYNQYLLPELKQFDFLLKVKHEIETDWAKGLLDQIKKMNAIEYVVQIDLEKIKNKENLLF